MCIKLQLQMLLAVPVAFAACFAAAAAANVQVLNGFDVRPA
jgi:hypothetical protein